MNKIKLCIMNCKSEINSLLKRIMGSEITHIIVTTNGDKIRCVESIELYESENKIIVAKCQTRLKDYIITINSENVEYITEIYNDESWDMILNISPINNDVDIENNNLFYA